MVRSRITSLLVFVGVVLGQAGCCTIPEDALFDDPPPAVAVEPSLSPIQRGIRYLHNTQVTAEQEAELEGRDWAGNWPQYATVELVPALSVRDVNPFVAACMHQTLSLVREDLAGVAGLGADDLELAREMRTRARELLERFDAEGSRLDAGAYGFWPLPEACGGFAQCLLLQVLTAGLLGDDDYRGDRAPLNVFFFPWTFKVPADADVTAKVFTARLTAHRAGDGPPLPAGLEHFFEDWRDLGEQPMRIELDWTAEPTGAYLTWLAYGAYFPTGTPQDVDLVVNANVLHFLGLYGRLDATGVDEAVALINEATGAGVHRDMGRISTYYPDTLLFHFAVARAYAEGNVAGLAPSVQILADEIEAEITWLPDGRAFWDRGDPALNTALAMLTLIHAGRAGAAIEGGARFLESAQNPVLGNWPASPFFQGTSSNGITIVWDSSAWSTAMALEALIRVAVATSSPAG